MTLNFCCLGCSFETECKIQTQKKILLHEHRHEWHNASLQKIWDCVQTKQIAQHLDSQVNVLEQGPAHHPASASPNLEHPITLAKLKFCATFRVSTTFTSYHHMDEMLFCWGSCHCMKQSLSSPFRENAHTVNIKNAGPRGAGQDQAHLSEPGHVCSSGNWPWLLANAGPPGTLGHPGLVATEIPERHLWERRPVWSRAQKQLFDLVLPCGIVNSEQLWKSATCLWTARPISTYQSRPMSRVRVRFECLSLHFLRT